MKSQAARSASDEGDFARQLALAHWAPSSSFIHTAQGKGVRALQDPAGGPTMQDQDPRPGSKTSADPGPPVVAHHFHALEAARDVHAHAALPVSTRRPVGAVGIFSSQRVIELEEGGATILRV